MTYNATMTISELAKAIITLADEKSVMLVLAESCTGGMIAVQAGKKAPWATKPMTFPQA